jgi:cytochrome c556
MTTLNRSTIGFVGLACLLASACADQNATKQPPQRAQLAQAISTPPPRDSPEPLSPIAMATVKTRMASHARDMDRLVSAIMILDYPDIAARAKAIADDASLSRPLSNDATELNASLPEKFFARQDDLKAAARDLSAAASALNPYRVADAYGKVSATCVRCHADYRPRTGS